MCQDEYVLGDVLSQLPPALVVVDNGMSFAGESGTFDFAGFSSAATSPTSEAESEAAAGFVFQPNSAGPAAAQPITRAPRRPAKKPAVEIAKIVAGGLLAIPLAQLILWWLPGRWQRDPLKIGPTVGQYVPWVVPPNYRPAGVADEAPTDGDSTPIRRPSSEARRPLDKLRLPAENLSTSADSQVGRDTPQSPVAAPDAGSELPKESKSPAAVAADSIPSGESSDPATGATSPTPPSASGAADDAGNASFMVGVRNAPRLLAADLAAALERAKQANDA
jgi:hypothetical protein